MVGLWGNIGFFGGESEAEKGPRCDEGSEDSGGGVAEEAGGVAFREEELESEDDQSEGDDGEVTQGALLGGAIGGKANKAAFEGDAKAKAEDCGSGRDAGRVLEGKEDKEWEGEAQSDVKCEGLSRKPRREGGFDAPQQSDSEQSQEPTAKDILGEVNSEVESRKADQEGQDGKEYPEPKFAEVASKISCQGHKALCMAAWERKAFGVSDHADLGGIGAWDGEREFDDRVEQKDVQDSEAHAAAHTGIDAPIHQRQKQQVAFGITESRKDTEKGIEPRGCPRLDALEDLISPRDEAFEKGLHRVSLNVFVFVEGVFLARGRFDFVECLRLWTSDFFAVIDVAGFFVRAAFVDGVSADVEGFFVGSGAAIDDVMFSTSEDESEIADGYIGL